MTSENGEKRRGEGRKWRKEGREEVEAGSEGGSEGRKWGWASSPEITLAAPEESNRTSGLIPPADAIMSLFLGTSANSASTAALCSCAPGVPAVRRRTSGGMPPLSAIFTWGAGKSKGGGDKSGVRSRE